MYLPEQPPLYADMTVKEYLSFAAELKNVAKNERQEMIDDIMGLLSLTDVKDRLVKNLSKGYKQRVGLGQAMVGNPEILILDEPTVGLDPKQIIEIRSLIKDLSKEHTVILSSHILSEVSALCDQILIISHGKLVACDTSENLSQSMAGNTTLELSVLDKEQKTETLLAEQFGEDVFVKGNWIDDVWTGSLQVEGDEDIREKLFYLLADAKCPILELKQSSMSLEEIFLELTEPEQPEREEEEPEEALESIDEEAEADEGDL